MLPCVSIAFQIIVLQIQSSCFAAKEGRKDRLLEVIQDMDADVLSLVECDHYEVL